MTPADITVLIPAAGRVPDGIVALANITCPAMIPVAGRPVIHWTMRYLTSLGLARFRIAVPSRGLFVEDFVGCASDADARVDFIVPSRQAGLGRTVLDLLEGVETKGALIVLGDTHFELSNAEVLGGDEPFLVVHNVEESYRWCTCDVNESGKVVALHDKIDGRPTPTLALVGVYYFPDVVLARQAARAAVAEGEASRGRTEMAEILNKMMATTGFTAEPARLWVDVGNPDRLATSHRTLLAAREFNELSIDPVLGTLTKTSRHKKKFIDEVNYLRSLPLEIAVLFPRVLAYSTDWSSPSVTMEYYGYPTLSEIFIFEGVDPGIWEQVFEHLLAVIREGFLRRPEQLPTGSLQQMCINKTRERLASIVGPSALVRLVRHEGDLVINGRVVPSLQRMWPFIESHVCQLEATAVGTIIHGDLCFSNVLYDLRSRIVKLIDPRGSFHSPGLHGDIRYDIAKLYHSVAGFYDFIVNDLFNVDVRGLDVRLEIRSRPLHDEIRRRFERVFFEVFNERDVKFIAGLLFVSMPPLHADAPDRQLAMYARGLELLADCALDAEKLNGS